jgi:hypothetical protein
MSINQSDVDNVLGQARQFYKRSLKSSNKVYDLSRVSVLNNMKYSQRNANADQSNLERAKQSELADSRNISDNEFGRWLYVNGFKAGNCPEMSAIALHLAATLLAKRFKASFIVTVNYPGDHVFVLLSVNGDQPTWMHIPNMGRETGDNFWIIDCWFNIACPVQLYLLKVWQKLDQWAAQGKDILAEESQSSGTNRYDLREDKYRNNLLMGRLTYSNVTSS